MVSFLRFLDDRVTERNKLADTQHFSKYSVPDTIWHLHVSVDANRRSQYSPGPLRRAVDDGHCHWQVADRVVLHADSLVRR